MANLSKRPLKVFLCYASPDSKNVNELYLRLKNEGVDVWLDKENLIAGASWDREIRTAVRESDIVIVCLSRKFDKKGYRHNEMRVALEEANLQPEGEIFIIPARLEECDYPTSLRPFHGVDLFEANGYDRLIRALSLRAERIGLDFQLTKKQSFVSASTKAEELFSRALRFELSGNLLEALSVYYELKKLDPSDPKVDEKIRQLQEELKRNGKRFVPYGKSPRKLSIQLITAIISAAAVILAAIISVLPWKDWDAITPDIAIATNTISLSSITLTFTSVLPTETNTPTPSIPTLSIPTLSIPTLTPLPSELTDANGVVMHLVPAGDFLMGNGVEKHKIYLDNFYLDIYEVTNNAYKSCVDNLVCELPRNIKFYTNQKYTNDPVVYINWNMAKTYCDWRGGRLPTEAEWEKSARGTDSRLYPWGDDIDCDKANYFNGKQYCYKDTRPVGSYSVWRSPYGMYDMAGNVWEWVNSLYLPYPYDSSDGREELAQAGERVLRGGAWGNTEDLLQSHIRNKKDPSYISDLIGFRCARSP